MADRELAETAAEGFSVLANPLRVRILLALAGTRRPDWDHGGMSYSDLRSAVGVEDGGRFNYHLDELRDRFVVGEDGHYWLTVAGSRLVDEMYTGTFTGSHERREGPLSYQCMTTDANLTATVEHGVITVDCPEHGELFDMTLPFNVVAGRDLDELYEIGFRRAQRYVESVVSDVCPHCAARFEQSGVEYADRSYRSGILIGYRCQRCEIAFRLPIEDFMMFRPPVVGFFDDHGLDATSPELLHGDVDHHWGVHEHEDGFVVTVRVDDERLEIEVDRSLETRSVSREPVDS